MKKKDIFNSIFFVIFAPITTLLVIKSIFSIVYMLICFITWENLSVMNENLIWFMSLHPMTIRFLIIATVVLVIFFIIDAIKRKNK